MPKSAALLFRSAALAGLLALAACSAAASDNNLAEMDNSLIGNGADPALTSALEDQILVDPNLVQQIQSEHAPARRRRRSRRNIRPMAARRGRQASAAAGAAATAPATPSACGVPFVYGNQWADAPAGRIPGLSGRPRHRGGGQRPRRLPHARRHLHHRRSLQSGARTLSQPRRRAPASRPSSRPAAATRCSAAPAARRPII